MSQQQSSGEGTDNDYDAGILTHGRVAVGGSTTGTIEFTRTHAGRRGLDRGRG